MSDLPPFIMGLIGAPGAGKSATAQAIKTKLDPWLKENDLGELVVIDNLDRIIENEQGRAVGVYGDGYVSLAYYFLRQTLTDRAMGKKRCILTCGSLIDNIAHVNARIKVLSSMVQTPETGELVMREVMTGQIMATFIMDNRSPLHFGYYCPLPPQIIIPGREAGSFPVEVDEFIRELNVKMTLGMPVIEGTPDERADAAIANFHENYKGARSDSE